MAFTSSPNMPLRSVWLSWLFCRFGSVTSTTCGVVLDGTVSPLMSTDPGFSLAASLGSSPPENPAKTTTDSTPAAAMAGIHRFSGEGGGG